MNPVFWLLVILGAVAVWFLGSFVFYPLGLYIYRIWKDTVWSIERDDKEFGHQSREEQRGYQPSNSKPQNSEAAKATVKSDGNIAQKK